MFVLSQSDSYVWPVVLELPASGGKFDKHTFDAEFKRLPQSRIREIGKQIEVSELTDVELCKEVLVGWKGVQDQRGDDVPFSEGSMEKLLEVQLVAAAIVIAFFKSISGAKVKN